MTEKLTGKYQMSYISRFGQFDNISKTSKTNWGLAQGHKLWGLH